LGEDRQGPSALLARASVLAILEKQQAELDRIGAGKAAAHLDAAIEQLRRDCADLRQHHSDNRETSRKPIKSEVSPDRQVITRKATGTRLVYPQK